MSKRAEEKAVEYQIKIHGPNVMGGASMLSEEEYMRFNMNLDFKNGYELAEKDLALTWEDIEKITDIHRNVLYNNPKRIMGAKENYEDTLREFNEWREKNRATKNN